MRTKPGEILNKKVLHDNTTQLYNSGGFTAVGPWEETPTDVGKVAIKIPVVEKNG